MSSGKGKMDVLEAEGGEAGGRWEVGRRAGGEGGDEGSLEHTMQKATGDTGNQILHLIARSIRKKFECVCMCVCMCDVSSSDAQQVDHTGGCGRRLVM